MALTQAQWVEKIKGVLPRWYWINPGKQIAHVNGLAAILAQTQQDMEDHVGETFYQGSDTEFVEAHADERDIQRLPFEDNTNLADRTRHFINQSNPIALKKLVVRVLIAGECAILEDYESQVFLNWEFFLSRNIVLIDEIINVFSVLVDPQIHDPTSFISREYFCDREAFIGQYESSQVVFDTIVQVVNKNKIDGTLYRIIERLEP